MARHSNRCYLILSRYEMPNWWVDGQIIFIKQYGKDNGYVLTAKDKAMGQKGYSTISQGQIYSRVIAPGFYSVLHHSEQAILLIPDNTPTKFNQNPDSNFTFHSAPPMSEGEFAGVDPYTCDPFTLARWLRRQMIDYILDGKIPQGLSSTAALALDLAKVINEKDTVPKINMASELHKILNDPGLTGAARIAAVKELAKIADPTTKEPRKRIKIDITQPSTKGRKK